MTKYLIEELWIDPMENRDAHGYDPIGYVDTITQAKEFCSKGRKFTSKDCWSLFVSAPQYKYSKIRKLSIGKNNEMG